MVAGSLVVRDVDRYVIDRVRVTGSPGAAIDVRRSPGGTVTRVLARPRPVAPLPRPDRAPNRFSVAPRPTVVDDLAITGITRLSRGRWGSRLFTLFFVFVFAVILLQLIDSLLYPLYR